MMKKIGKGIQARQKIIPAPSKTKNLKALDICMAPGGFSATVLKHYRHAKVCALSLPRDEGGRDVLLPDWKTDKRFEIQFIDVTMLAAEIGFPDLVRQGHPEATKFSNDIPFEGQAFDVVFCGGQVVHTHARADGSNNEARRLTAAQLIIALQRITPGGALVLLLHQAYSPYTVRLLEAFSHFSDISLFKPFTSFEHRSFFYLVAKNLDPGNERARCLLRDLRRSWRILTVQGFGIELPENDVEEDYREATMEEVMDTFTEKLITLAEPTWEIQKSALERMFLKEQR